MRADSVQGDGEYAERRAWIADYFGRTAAQRWASLTTDAPVGRIAQSVRAGREAMMAALLRMLPRHLEGRRILDAGCGTGAVARVLAERGAFVVGVDVAPALLEVARQRTPADLRSRIEFRAADMIDDTLGRFDHVVAMDSLIHYAQREAVAILASFAARTRYSVAFTFAPRTPFLAAMHAFGRMFPAGNRAPAIEPVEETTLSSALRQATSVSGWRWVSGPRISRKFYISQAALLQRAADTRERLS